MRRRRQAKVDGKLITAAVFVAVVAGAFGLGLLGTGANDSTRADGPDNSPEASVTGADFRGIALQLHSGHPDHPYETYIEEIAAVGANTVCLVVPGYQENASSTSIFIDARKAPGDERLLELMEHARRLDLRVVLMPVVLLDNPGSGQWRGKLNPNNWVDWWDNYNAFVLHYADVARRGGAEVFVVGSELVSTERHQQRWRYLIEQVRERFHGLLSYSANWDHFKPVQWWDAVDLIGMTSYYDLTGGDEPTLDRMTDSWREIRDDVLQWQRKQGKPILFTEVGWPSQETGAQYPWDYLRATDRPAPGLQADCFEAFFRTWFDQPTVAGFVVWEWRNYPQQPTGPEDPSYVPVGKPALDVIKEYYRRHSDRDVEEVATQPAADTEPPAHQDTAEATDDHQP